MDDAAQTDLLFVYGTLRRACDHAMSRILATRAAYLGDARIRGRLYRVADYPGAVLSGDPHERVLGELCRLRAPAMLLPLLDAYEGLGSPLTPGEFERRIVPVERPGGARVDAWIYLYRGSTAGLERIPSGDFLSPAPNP